MTPIQVQISLKGVDYPTGKHTLLARAQTAGADAPVLEALTHLPEQRYASPIEVSRALRTHQARGQSAEGCRKASVMGGSWGCGEIRDEHMGEGARRMAEGMAAAGPQAGLTEQLKDALYQAYQQFVMTHPGDVSPATATHGVLAAAAHILATIHGHASPDEEALVSWDALKDTCVAELDRLLREPQAAHRGGTS